MRHVARILLNSAIGAIAGVRLGAPHGEARLVRLTNVIGNVILYAAGAVLLLLLGALGAASAWAAFDGLRGWDWLSSVHPKNVPWNQRLGSFAFYAAFAYVCFAGVWSRVRRVLRRFLPTKERNPYACPDCGYDLRATPDRCPECGRVREWIEG